ncbi:MAG: DUF4838 domain-containing protein [Bacteroidaceae bacterium]|nr:DUF4838 domain-containing protein [Bacteroidaceae bacterium]
MEKLLTFFLLAFTLPSFNSCKQVVANDEDAAFEYRDIYLPGNSKDEGRLLGLHNLDRNWGIWGHNIGRILPKDHSRSIYATVEGRMNTDQYCFSSEKLFQYIVDFIDDKYDTNTTTRFAILPNDNRIVCLCPDCIAKGCTYNDASPAVNSMIRRLAERFPQHIFFTSNYLTTRSVPTEPMPENTGVLISAIDYSLCAKATTREEEMKALLNKWANVTSHMYVWDYICNFDDYFTPFPVFTVMQRRFQLYRDAGVSGLFLNGSGYDYSTFSRVKTRVLVALMKDPDTDWVRALKDACRELYPVAGDIIADYMQKQEHYVQTTAKMLPLYEGVNNSLRSHLAEQDFITFHDQLRSILPRCNGDERKELSLMYRTMCLTRLEIMRIHANVQDARPLLEQLQTVIEDGVKFYSESYWSVENYIEDYRSMLTDAEEQRRHRQLVGKPLTALTALDPDYPDLSIVSDGLCGLPHNYHCGNLISSADPWLRIAIPNAGELHNIRVSMVRNVQAHIGIPKLVKISVGDTELGKIVPPTIHEINGRSIVEFAIPFRTEGTLVLTIVRDKEERTMAIDEITGW